MQKLNQCGSQVAAEIMNNYKIAVAGLKLVDGYLKLGASRVDDVSGGDCEAFRRGRTGVGQDRTERRGRCEDLKDCTNGTYFPTCVHESGHSWFDQIVASLPFVGRSDGGAC